METVHVLATSFDETAAAIRTAAALARDAHARLVVLLAHVVPYALTLDHPADSPGVVADRYQALVREYAHGLEPAPRVLVCLCRRPSDVVADLLPPQSTVIVGGSAGGLLPNRSLRLIRWMLQRGHQVVFVPVSSEAA